MEQKQEEKLYLTSEAFEQNQVIPKQYSCNGKNINPPLLIQNIPKEAKSFALVVNDPDAPDGDWVHWLVWNIPASNIRIESGLLPSNSIQGLNDSHNNKYNGPCPPSGTHRYFFRLYALDTMLDLDEDNHKIDLENAMEGHIIDQTFLVGMYSKLK